MEDLPEPFRSAIATGRFRDVVEAEARDPPALYARGVALLMQGALSAARRDLEAAQEVIADPCRVELALLGLDGTEDPLALERELGRILRRLPRDTWWAARARHVLGIALAKSRRHGPAVAHLVQAKETYANLGFVACRAQVLDSLGSVYAGAGSLDQGLACYAQSLVDKVVAGDRHGMAITLGNIGRVQLKAGRFSDALECFRRDLEIACETGDRRGEARMLGDIGRTLLALGDHERAEGHLREALVAADGFPDVECSVHKDLAVTAVRRRRLEQAASEIETAEGLAAELRLPHFAPMIRAVRGEWEGAQSAAAGTQLIAAAADDFAKLELPDSEIPARIALARLCCETGRRAEAEQALLRGVSLARKGGFLRYVSEIEELMIALDLIEPVSLEQARISPAGTTVPVPGGYTVLDALPVARGGYGSVYRAYDPRRGMRVALKRLIPRNRHPYDPETREQLLASARREYDAAARLRHPGLARVHAVGVDPEGHPYVVQDYVEGRPLNQILERGERGDPRFAFETLQKLAWILEPLHAAGIVHRDIKPGNIILRAPNWDPVLIDLGIALFVQPGQSSEGGQGEGTPRYMAPEQIDRRSVGAPADIYALGVLTYAWLSGRNPAAAWARVDALSHDDPDPIVGIESVCSGLPSSLCDLIHTMMAPDPALRPDAGLVATQAGAGVQSLPRSAATFLAHIGSDPTQELDDEWFLE